MNKRIVILSAAATLAVLSIFGAVVTNYLRSSPISNEPNNISEPVSSEHSITGTSASAQTVLDNPSEKEIMFYTIKDYNGKIAVFNNNSAFPEEIYERNVNSFPPIDQELLKNGIIANTREELERKLEDYIS